LLEGKTVNLRVMEKEDVPLFTEWVNKPEVFGEYNPLHQMSKTEVEKMLDNPSDLQFFFVEKKDGSKIGFIAHFHVLHLGTGSKLLEIGYSLVQVKEARATAQKLWRLWWIICFFLECLCVFRLARTLEIFLLRGFWRKLVSKEKA